MNTLYIYMLSLRPRPFRPGSAPPVLGSKLSEQSSEQVHLPRVPELPRYQECLSGVPSDFFTVIERFDEYLVQGYRAIAGQLNDLDIPAYFF